MTLIKDLKNNMKGVNMNLEIVEIGEIREVKDNLRVVDCIVKDEEDNQIKLVVWNENIDKLQMGMPITIRNCFCKYDDYNNKLSLTLGKFGKLTTAEEKVKEEEDGS